MPFRIQTDPLPERLKERSVPFVLHVWNISNTISKAYFELVLADFAKSIDAGPNKRVVLQLDNAGWHGPENLTVPNGIRLLFQPAHSPELQPAEHLWAFVDEPLVNRYFKTIGDLDQAVAKHARGPMWGGEASGTVEAVALCHGLPKGAQGS
jgi:hypothetical protein